MNGNSDSDIELQKLEQEIRADEQAEAGEEKAKEQAEAAESVPDQSASIAAALTMTVSMLQPMFPSLGQIYKPDVIKQLAEKGAALTAKHGFVLADFLARWREEIEFTALALPVGLATYQGVLGDLDRRKAESESPKQQTENDPA